MTVSADKDARLLLLQDELRYTTYFFPFGFLRSLLPLLGLLNMPSKQKQKGGVWKSTAAYPNVQPLSDLQCGAKIRVALHSFIPISAKTNVFCSSRE